MKVLLKFWLIVILSFITILTIVSSCDNTPTAQRNTTTGTPSTSGKSGSNTGGTDDPLDCKTLELTCQSSCCDEKPCKDKCTQGNDNKGYLNLTTSTCKKLKEDTVTDLVESFKIILNPEEDDDEVNLYQLSDSHIDLVCSAVITFEDDILTKTQVENYNDDEALMILGWLAQKKSAGQIFKSISDDNRVQVFETLLREAVGDDGSTAVLNGLKAHVTDENGRDDDEYNVLQSALSHGNEYLIRFIYDILTEEDDSLCGDDSGNERLPTPDTATGGTTYTSEAVAEDNKHLACILGVYCNISEGVGNSNKQRQFMEDIAEKVNSSKIRRFIKETIAKGGLGLTSSSAYDDWRGVCPELKKLWKDNTSIATPITGDNALDLGLDGAD